jgi:subtilisin-like proprotein convertase family protein/subtilisin family serine protease
MKSKIFTGIAIFLVSQAYASAEDTLIYRVQSSGLQRLFQLVGETQVTEVTTPAKSSIVYDMEPVLSIAVPRVADVPHLATSTGALNWKQAPTGGFYLLGFPSNRAALEAAQRLSGQGWDVSPDLRRKKTSRFNPTDPLFKNQWHLKNLAQLGGIAGIDLNLSTAWNSYRGQGINVAVVDDGLQLSHPDLAANCFPLSSNRTQSLHFDFNNNDTNPAPTSDDVHGTSVAGLLAASSNTLGGLGVAPEARLGGLRLTADSTTPSTDASAFGWKNSVFHIYNNSWGPSDDGMTTEAPDSVVLSAMERAVKFGRGGLGCIFVWACGNGRVEGDNSNYDGYANSIYTIAVGAVSDRGSITTESESGANVVAVVPSSSLDRQGLCTTDLVGKSGYNFDGSNDGSVIPTTNFKDLNYTNDFGMTSGATPLVSGVVALILQANPKLGWRDVQEILMRTARKVSPTDTDWKRNTAGFWFNHKFGAGLVDTNAAVNLAKTWKNLAASTPIFMEQKNLNKNIPDNSPSGTVVTFDFSSKAPNFRVEHVQFTVSVNHSYVGDLKYVLTSPSGMQSIVEPRPNDSSTSLENWTFMSVRHWGEAAKGVWKLSVIDTESGDTGSLISAKITLHGTALSTL